MTWAHRKRIKLALIGAGYGAFGALLFSLRNLFDPGALGDATDSIETKLGFLSPLLQLPWVNGWIAAHPTPTVAIAGFVTVGMTLFGFLGRRTHDRFFASFNDDVLQPVVSSDATADRDGAAPVFIRLPWRLGETGVRREIWDRLWQWTQSMGERRRWRPLQTGYSKTYSVGFLVGRGGSGKSRLAAEFARTLDRRDMLGDSNEWDARRPNGGARLAIGAYVRRTMPFGRPLADDPWDVGVLRNTSKVDQQDRYIETLRTWRPRRPTLVILDDPGAGEAGRVHAALCEVAERARHPVCLLIVDQVVPASGPLAYDASDRCWKFDRFAAADPEPFLLSASSWFGPKETREIAFAHGVLRDQTEAAKSEVRERLYPLTEGNPLLIELALEWIRDHGTLGGVTVPELRQARMRRVIDALARRGITVASQWTQLVLAAMVGGAERKVVLDAIREERVIGAVTDLPAVGDLQACFPAEDLQTGGSRIPPIRPDLLTAALIDALWERGDDVGEPEALIRAAFRIDPAMMLRRQRFLVASKRLEPALARIDPENIAGITPLQWAEAYADIAVHAGPQDPERWTTDLFAARMETAERAIGRLGRLDREAILPILARFVPSSKEPGAERRLIPGALLKLIHIAAAPNSVRVEGQYWIDLFESLRGVASGEADFGPLDGPVRAAKRLANDLGKADRFFDAVWAIGSDWRRACTEVFAALSPEIGDPESGVRKVRIDALVAFLDAGQDEAAVAAARLTIDGALRQALTFPDDPRIQREIAKARSYEAFAWCQVPGSAQASSARSAADRGAEIAAAFPADAGIQEEAAKARRFAEYAEEQSQRSGSNG